LKGGENIQMSGISMISTAAAGQATVAAGSMTSSANAQAGTMADGSSFASLFVGLLTGQALPAKAQGESLVQWLTGGLELQAESVETGPGQSVSWEAILGQLSALFASLPSVMKDKLAAQPEVKEWMAMANAELAMAGESFLTLLVPNGEQMEASVAGSGQEVFKALDHLLGALKANPESPYLPAVAEQARHVFAKALGALASMETAAANATSTLMQSTAAEQMNETSLLLSKKAELALLLKQTNGEVDTATTTKQESQVGQVRLSHLSAMEAKTSMFRFVTLEGAGAAASLEASAAVNGSSSQAADTALLSGNGLESLKTGGSESAGKAESVQPQRIPLSNAAEHLNAWIMKQASGGGNLKTETVIRLMPEHLGQVEVKISMQNGQLAATITTESAMAKDVLESNLAMLRSSLQSQGVTVERLVVSHQQTSGFQSGLFQEERGRQPSGRESERESRTRKEEDAEWADVLAGNSELEAAMETYRSGSSFRAEA
jgi:flagellar hook-length control protein FliK